MALDALAGKWEEVKWAEAMGMEVLDAAVSEDLARWAEARWVATVSELGVDFLHLVLL